jgi:amino acid adenylation domain-containing protein
VDPLADALSKELLPSMNLTDASTFVDVVAERSTRPGRAFTFVDGSGGRKELTFEGLHRRACAIGAMLADRGLAGQRVLVLLPPGLDYVAAFLGCLYAGAVAVPLYPPEANQGSTRHLAVSRNCAPAAAIGLVGSDGHQDGLPVLTVEDPLPHPGDWRRPAIDRDSLAFLQYTSGSTAAPKGVMVTHGNLVANSRQIARRFGTSESSIAVSWLPPYHDMGLIGGILQPIYAGAEATLFSPMTFIARPALWLRLISELRAQMSGGPDFAYDLCAKRIREEDLTGLDLSSWEVAFSGAEPVRAATLERFARRMAPYGFRAESFFPCYGLAEATLLVSGRRVGETPIAERFDSQSLAPGSVPRPAADGLPLVGSGPVADGVDVKVVGLGTDVPCPGEVGEICVSGDNVAAGYWGRAEDTTATFGTDGNRLLRTGDLGFYRDGQLYITGRDKDMLVVRGRNHYPQDLELTASDAHDEVGRIAAAFAIEVDGREEVCLVAEVGTEREPGAYDQISAAIRARLKVEHGLVPRSLVLVRRGQIARTTSGKVQRARTKDLLASGMLKVVARWDSPGDGALPAFPGDVGAQTVRETVLAIAEQRLGVRVRPDVPLIAQGMDSLAALEIKAAVAEAVRVELPLEALLTGAAIDELDLAGKGAVPVGAAAPDPGGRYPLTINQQALWFLEQQHPGTAAQHVYVAVRLLAEVDANALRRSFQALIDRHPVLRTALHWGDGAPYQEILTHQEAAFVIEDASALDDAGLRERLDREAAGELFGLSEGRLMRAVLLRRPDGDVLSLVAHHIAVDMWSLAIIADELGRLYAVETGRARTLPPPPAAGYGELARFQRAMLESSRGEQLWRYWQNQLAGCRPVVELPADRPRPRQQSYRGDTVVVDLGAQVTVALRDLAAAEGTTLFVVLLAVFQTLVHRYSGEPDVLIGVPSSGRADSRLHDVVGYFVNPLLIRSQISDVSSFTEHLRNTKETMLGALAHQDMPFPVLVERLRLQREASRPPGYQLMFSLTNPHLLGAEGLGALQTGRGGARMRIGDLEVESIDLVRRTAQVDVTMVLSEVDDHLEGLINFSTDLFDRATMVRFGEHFSTLARTVTAQPGLAPADVPLVTDGELRAFARWNNTTREYPRAAVTDLFATQVAARPDEPALTYGRTSLTYRQLDRASTGLARALRARGAGLGRTVGLCTDHDAAVVVAMLATAKAGAAYVPLDPGHPPVRLRRIIDESRPVVLVAPPGIGHERLEASLPAVDPSAFMTEDVLADPANDAPLDTGPCHDDLLYVMYTSGSSGEPKGICVTHNNVLRLVRNTNYCTFEPGDRIAQISNAAFDAATLEVWGAVINGGHLIGFDRATVLAPDRLAAEIRRLGIDIMVMATPLFTQIAGYDPKTFATVRQLMVGGDTMDPKRARDVVALGYPLLTNGYGPTESTTFATAQPLREIDDGLWRVPIGGPIANTQVHILDERMEPVPIGVPGELFIGGEGLARGYLGRPDLTAERFRPDPFSAVPGARLYATGDLARWLPSGSVDFVGRTDFQVKIRGYRVEPAEVDVVTLAHPDVSEAVTVTDDSTGEKRLITYYVGVPKPDDLASFLRDRLPEYLVPSLRALPELPKNPNGKVDRAALPKPESVAAHSAARSPAADGRVGDIAALLCELLGAAEVAPDDNFFEIGGHSLLAIKLIGEIRDRYGVEIPLNDLFTDPSPKGIAEFIQTQPDIGAAATEGPQRVARRVFTP